MWAFWAFLGILLLIAGGYFFAKWRIKKKGWKAGGGVWFAIFLLYVGTWTYIRWPFTQEEKEIEEIQIKEENRDTIQWHRT